MYSYWEKIEKNPNPTAYKQKRYNFKHFEYSTRVWGDQLSATFSWLGKRKILQ